MTTSPKEHPYSSMTPNGHRLMCPSRQLSKKNAVFFVLARVEKSSLEFQARPASQEWPPDLPLKQPARLHWRSWLWMAHMFLACTLQWPGIDMTEIARFTFQSKIFCTLQSARESSNGQLEQTWAICSPKNRWRPAPHSSREFVPEKLGKNDFEPR